MLKTCIPRRHIVNPMKDVSWNNMDYSVIWFDYVNTIYKKPLIIAWEPLHGTNGNIHTLDGFLRAISDVLNAQ